MMTPETISPHREEGAIYVIGLADAILELCVAPVRTRVGTYDMALTVKCATCGAEPRDPCRTTSDIPTMPHKQRILDAFTMRRVASSER
jgi:hypothetical protein